MRYPPGSDDWNEAKRLRVEERRERDEIEEWPDTPEERWVRANAGHATEQIYALQGWAEDMIPDWHPKQNHGELFKDCKYPVCRRLRDRLRPIPRIETYAP